ncbi:protein rep [Paenibacillus sp. SI8]|uniref:protein rep n=1 Tax=unclassified Paenibacillus TaxID=185978 RepID=UPI003465909B
MNIDIDSIKLDFEFLNSVATNVDYNEQILGYYAALIAEVDEKLDDDARYEHLRESVASKSVSFIDYQVSSHLRQTNKQLYRKLETMFCCNDKWFFDVYEEQKVKDFQKTNLCRDKFCNNCKKVGQASRMARYIPEIEKYVHCKKIHLVLTAPNVNGVDLKDTIKIYFKCYARLIEYLKGKEVIKGYDFSSWGYEGAVRSLEVTYSGDSYHPHIHSLLLMNEGFEIGSKCIKNAFSKKNGRIRRRFSEKEELIQKIWYLLVNGVRVNKKNIEDLDLGYSCMMDEFKEGDYHELFKYMTKGNGSGNSDDEDAFMSFDNFKILYFALMSVRQIQGYGCLYHIEDTGIEEKFDEVYDSLIEQLREKEKPRVATQSPRDSIYDIGQYRLISRKRYHSYLRTLYQAESAATTVNIVEQLEFTEKGQ